MSVEGTIKQLCISIYMSYTVTDWPREAVVSTWINSELI
jgi:hypothetical protein